MDALELGERPGADVDRQHRPVGHDVVGRPGRGLGRGHRRPGLGSRERGQVEGPAGQLGEGVAPLLRLQPGVRGETGERDVVEAAALAAGLERAGQARLEDQDRHRPRREVLDQRARGDRAGLLVAGDQHRDPGGVGEGGHRLEARQDPGLHVEDTRAGRARAVAPERPPVGGPGREDGVDVTRPAAPGPRPRLPPTAGGVRRRRPARPEADRTPARPTRAAAACAARSRTASLDGVSRCTAARGGRSALAVDRHDRPHRAADQKSSSAAAVSAGASSAR